MGEIADMILDGILDEVTGEYIGPGVGYPRTLTKRRKSEDLSWKKVTGWIGSTGIKQHLFPDVLKEYGVKYSGKNPLRNACFEILKEPQKFKDWLLVNSNKFILKVN